MTSFGVLNTGFNAKSIDDILTELEDDERAAFGAEFNTQADSVAGQLNGIVGDKIAELWEVSQAVYRARQPDSASGESLDQVGALTGALRQAAASSVATLNLNLDDGTTVSADSIVRIGAAGERWITRSEVENSSGAQSTVSVLADSETEGPIVGNATTIDTIATPVSGWSAKAALEAQNTEPYNLADTETLLVSVDEGAEETATFNTGDFVDITAATAAEVASAIAADVTGITAVDANGKIRLVSDTDGTGSALEVTGGTGAPALGFTQALIKGFNWSTSAQITSGNAETYDLDDGDTLTVSVDQGAEETATFNTGDFVDIDNATAVEVAKVINTDITGVAAYEVDGKVVIESTTTGSNSSIEVTGGTGNVALGFEEDEEKAGVSGDATPGRNEETDAEFRLSRELLLRQSGAAATEAIRSAVLAVDGVLQAFVFENDTDATDGDGRPPHSVEVVVDQGLATDTEVAEAIFATVGAGIATFKVAGPDGVTVVLTDSQGFSQTINYSQATETEMYIEVDVSVTQSLYGAGSQTAGDEEVKDALKDLGDTLQIGSDVIIARFLCAPFDVTGVVDVTDIKIEDTSPPTNTANIAISARELAKFSTARITVNVVFV